MTVFKTDSRLARSVFAGVIDWAGRIGQSQLEHFYRTLTEEFGSRTYVGVLTAIKDDLHARHAALLGAGIVDQHEDKGLTMSVVSLSEGHALSVRSPDGDNLLLAWKQNEEGDIEIAVIPWKDKAPASLVEEIREIVTANPTHAQLSDLAKRASYYSGLGLETDHLINSGLSLSIDDITGFISEAGFKDAVASMSLGEYRSRGRTYGGDVFILTVDGRAHHPGMIGYAEKLASAFTPNRKVRGYEEANAHLAALLDGQLVDLYHSACALSMEFNIETGIDVISEIIENCEKLNLSAETAYAHGDEDLIVQGQRFAGRDLYMHTNIDLNEGCTYATLLSCDENGYSRCDVYLVRPWNSGFEGYFGSDLSKPANERLAEHFLRYAIKDYDKGRIPHDRLVAAIEDGRLPAEGRVFSYDLKTGAMKVDTELARGTGYLDYFRLMTKGDRQALAEILCGEDKGWGSTFISRSIEDGPTAKPSKVEPSEYLASLECPTREPAVPKP